MLKELALPLLGPPPPEIALPKTPLVSVTAQVRFPTLLAVRNADRIIDFQDLIRARYPYLERQDIPTIIIGAGVPSGSMGEAAVHWRFADESSSWKWRITLSQDFVALETRAYESRENFIERLESIVQALEDTLAPTHMTRFGIRYIDQIKGEPMSRIATLLRSEVMGVACSLGANARQLFTEIVVAAEPGELVARWGKLPPGMTFDPNLAPPIQEDSWLIDLDVSKGGQFPFEKKTVVETANRAAERVYAVFRWMVTKDFLRTYGGDV
jgi:uncharacterized protein (TIGR04255 family)